MSAASPPPARTVPIDVAREMLADRIIPLTGNETVVLDASLGRLAATDITSAIDLPRTHNAAVDGYGVSAKFDGFFNRIHFNLLPTRLPIFGKWDLLLLQFKETNPLRIRFCIPRKKPRLLTQC